MFNRGFAYLVTKRLNEAIADFDRVILIDPKLQSVYVWRAKSYHQLKKYDLALADYSKGIELEPRNAEAVYGRGTVYWEKKLEDKGLADYERAIELNPEDWLYRYTRGWLYLGVEIGRWPRTISKKRRSLKNSKSIALMSRAWVLRTLILVLQFLQSHTDRHQPTRGRSPARRGKESKADSDYSRPAFVFARWKPVLDLR